MVSCKFRKKIEAGVWNKYIFRILFCVLLTAYVEIMIKSTIYGDFSDPAVCFRINRCYPHTGVRRTPVGSSWAYMYFCPFIRVAFWQSFARTVIVCSACGWRPQDKIPWVAVYYFHPSGRPVIRRTFAIFVLVLFSSMGVQCRDTFIPTLGSSWACMYFYLFLRLSGHISRF